MTSPIEPQCFAPPFYGSCLELKSPENLLLSSGKISLCRTTSACWQNVLRPREAANWSLSAPRIPSSLNLQPLLSHHSIKSAEKGRPLVLTKLGIEPVTWCQISKILSSPDKPLSEYILFIQNCLFEVWRNFPREIPIPFCPTCHLVEQELKIWKVT